MPHAYPRPKYELETDSPWFCHPCRTSFDTREQFIEHWNGTHW